MAVPKLLELQLKHIKDMIKEQNRMVITEVEPTASEREDILSLLDTIRTGVHNGGRSLVAAIEPEYAIICGDLTELGYNVKSYSLKIPEERRKQVRFTDESDDSAQDESCAVDGGFDTNGGSFDTNGSVTYERYSDLTPMQIYEQNNDIFSDQDRRLEAIGGSIGRQRALAEDINEELDVHNDLLDDLEAQTERSQGRIDGLSRGVRQFNRKSRGCGVCSIIITLVLILFILLLL